MRFALCLLFSILSINVSAAGDDGNWAGIIDSHEFQELNVKDRVAWTLGFIDGILINSLMNKSAVKQGISIDEFTWLNRCIGDELRVKEHLNKPPSKVEFT